jgi:hypothetical protein
MPTPLVELIDSVADIWLSLQGFAKALDTWNKAPRTGTIFLAGVESPSMTTVDAPIDIPTDDVPCRVVWKDRFGGATPEAGTTTTWATADPVSGADVSDIVTVVPDPANDEHGTVTFKASTGQFKVMATTQGADGPITAESAAYNIVPGAPVVGEIILNG